MPPRSGRRVQWWAVPLKGSTAQQEEDYLRLVVSRLLASQTSSAELKARQTRPALYGLATWMFPRQSKAAGNGGWAACCCDKVARSLRKRRERETIRDYVRTMTKNATVHDASNNEALLGSWIYRRNSNWYTRTRQRSVPVSTTARLWLRIRRLSNMEWVPTGLDGTGRQLCALSRTRRRRMADLERLSARLYRPGR
jgi:hypothetical protein